MRYFHLYTHIHSLILGSTCAIDFSSEEISKFERRLEEGYDIKSDVRYNAWLSEFAHPMTADLTFLYKWQKSVLLLLVRRLL